MKKRLVEYDLPLADISEASAREKNIRHGHPSTLHIWWARRPLAASRATAFAALIDDPGEDDPEKREYLLELIKKITPWEAVKDGNNEAIEEARRLILEQYGEPPKVLDPFAGGGSIPLEALRLGCETYASDYNPVAVFIEKATLEWPQKFGIMVDRSLLEESEERSTQPSLLPDKEGDKVNLLAYLVEKWANIILEEARAEIGQFYPTESSQGLVGKREIIEEDGWIPAAYLWARTIQCQNPSCRAEIPLIRQFWLAKKADKKIAYRPLIDQLSKQVEFELLEGGETWHETYFEPGEGTVSNGNARCLVCNQVVKNDQVRALSNSGQMGERLIAVVLHHPFETGKKYRLATEADRQLFERVNGCLNEKLSAWPFLESPLPDEVINPKRPSPNARGLSSITRYHYKRFSDMYNPRQKLALITLVQALRENEPEIKKDISRHTKVLEQQQVDAVAVTKAITGYLVIIMTRMLDRLTMFSRWDNSRETIVAALSSDKKLPMIWDFAETNPFSGSGGGWESQYDWVLRFLEANRNQQPIDITVMQNTATNLPYTEEYFDAVLTDPPYYDNYPYADLSDYYYVWMKRVLSESFPELFATPLTPKDQEAVMLTSRHPDGEDAKHFFERQLQRSFAEMHRILKQHGVAVIVYAHTTTEGWETMLNALIKSKFVVTGSWPVHTEMKNKVQAASAAFLASSIYMVCRKQERQPLGFWNELQPRIKARVEEKLEQFWAHGIAGGDFFISAIGPGMEEYSRYERVESYRGESVGTDQLLAFIRKVSTDFLVNRLLKGSSAGAIDKEAQFYLTYRWTYLNNKVPYDDARKIASAEGVDLELLWSKGGFVKKSGSTVEVLGPRQRGEIREVKNMVDSMHQAARLWEKGRKAELTSLLANTGYGQSGAFWQFCQAVAETLLNGSKEKQLLEGLLIGKDTYVRDSAEIAAEAQKPRLKQRGLFDGNSLE